jgi:adenylyltransferase/sulfurtransferase
MFVGIGEEGQAKLLRSSVVIIGCGALGCNIATSLVRAGIGKSKIVDRDFIEYHNLQRQILFNEDDIRAGIPKAIAAERHLSKVNSTIEIQGIVADVNYTNVEEFCCGADVILDGLDNIETRFLINDVSLKCKIPWVYGGAIGSTGMTMTVIPGKTPCFRCFHPSLPFPGSIPTCETAGIVGTVPAIIGSIQATEAMKILVGVEEINREIIMIDVWKGICEHIRIERRKGCPTCGDRYEFLEAKFTVRTTSLCGQSRAVQVVNTKVTAVDLDKIAARLQDVSNIRREEYMLRFDADNYEIMIFPDGRAIIKNTIDESQAKDLYNKYMGALIQSPIEEQLP